MLDGDKANKNRVCGMLVSKNIELVLLNGHGASNKITGQDNEVLINLNNSPRKLPRRCLGTLI